MSDRYEVVPVSAGGGTLWGIRDRVIGGAAVGRFARRESALRLADLLQDEVELGGSADVRIREARNLGRIHAGMGTPLRPATMWFEQQGEAYSRGFLEMSTARSMMAEEEPGAESPWGLSEP